MHIKAKKSFTINYLIAKLFSLGSGLHGFIAKQLGNCLLRHSKIFRVSCLALFAIPLSGCVAGILAGQAINVARMGYTSYNMLNPEKNVNLTLDHMGTIRMRSQLNGVNHIAILANNEMATSFADFWEDAGKQASIITEYGDLAVLSKSQASTALTAACKPSIDATIYGRMKDADSNSLDAVLGKATTTIKADLFVYSCRLKRLDSSPVTIVFNAMGQTSSQLDRSVGAGVAAKLIEITNQYSSDSK